MATNVKDLFAQAVATQMPHVFYIPPPDSGAVATYNNPFDSSKYDTGTGRNTTPSWMRDPQEGEWDPEGLGSKARVGWLLPHSTRPFKSRHAGERDIGYIQARNENPFQGVVGGASGEGNSVEQPVETGWIAPEFVTESSYPLPLNDVEQRPSEEVTQQEFEQLVNAKGTQYNPGMWTQFNDWVAAQSGGGLGKDMARLFIDTVIAATLPSSFELGANAGAQLFGSPQGALATGALAEGLDDRFGAHKLNPFSWPRRITGEIFNGQKPGQPIPQREDQKPTTDVTYEFVPNAPSSMSHTTTGPTNTPVPVEDSEGNNVGVEFPFSTQETEVDLENIAPSAEDLADLVDGGGLAPVQLGQGGVIAIGTDNPADGGTNRTIEWDDGSVTRESVDADGNYTGKTINLGFVGGGGGETGSTDPLQGFWDSLTQPQTDNSDGGGKSAWQRFLEWLLNK